MQVEAYNGCKLEEAREAYRLGYIAAMKEVEDYFYNDDMEGGECIDKIGELVDDMSNIEVENN